MGALKAHCCAEVRAVTKAGPMVGQIPAKTADQTAGRRLTAP